MLPLRAGLHGPAARGMVPLVDDLMAGRALAMLLQQLAAQGAAVGTAFHLVSEGDEAGALIAVPAPRAARGWVDRLRAGLCDVTPIAAFLAIDCHRKKRLSRSRARYGLVCFSCS